MNTSNFNYDKPYLLNRVEAAKFLGIDPKTFDKYVRPRNDLKRCYIGKLERYTTNHLIELVQKLSE